MNRTALFAALVAVAAPVALAPVAALAETAATAPGYSTADTSLGTLLDNPAAKAVLAKYIPDMIANPQIDMARGMTLKQLQSYAGDALTDEKLAKIDAELAKVPAK